MNRCAINGCLMICVAAASASWAQSSQTFIQIDKSPVPLVVEYELSDLQIDLQGSVDLVDEDGNVVAQGQVGPPKLGKTNADVKVLTLVLPSNVDSPKDLEIIAGTKPPEESFSWHWDDDKAAELRFGDRPVLRYMCETLDRSSPDRIGETYKAYHHMYDPRGEQLVTKGPGGLYPHHRGLYYGFSKISYGQQQADTWHCNNGEFQLHVGEVSADVGPAYGRHRVQIDWHGRDGEVFASEIRELTAYNTDGGNLIEFRSRLTTDLPLVQLRGDPQHAGFQFRASQFVPDHTKDQTYYLRPDGPDKPGSFRNWSDRADEIELNRSHVNLPWNALSFVLEGDRRFTCCYLDHPENPKPARYSERDYGRFGSDFEFDLTPDRPLDVQYRIWLVEGEMTADQVSALSVNFAGDENWGGEAR